MKSNDNDDQRRLDNPGEYFEHLGVQSKDETEAKLTNQKREDLFVQLLYDMALALGFDFDKTHIRTHIYSHVGHGEAEFDQLVIRRGVAQVLLGKRSIPIAITETPPEDESQRAFREHTQFMQSGRAWPVQIVPPLEPGKSRGISDAPPESPQPKA